MTTTEPLLALRCRALVRRYGDIVAVDGLDLEVHRGECFGLLGPNGAGKTTTVEILEGLDQPDGGDVEVLGERWHGDDIELRRRIGVQLQETKYSDSLRVREVVTLFRSFYPKGLGVREVIGLVHLEDKAEALVRTLSGGQLQRMSLACALVGDPELVFLDEPTTGLDPHSRREAWAIIEQLKRRNRTVLLTTHYMEEAARLCDRVAIVDRGKVIALGAPRELIAALGAEHVIEFTVASGAASAVGADELSALPSVERVARQDDTFRLTVREVHQALPALLALLTARAAPATHLSTHHATLEDVFMSLTGRRLEDA